MSVKCDNWYAWLNKMPPAPDDFHVTGQVIVGNPGVEAILTKRDPQGFNPGVLMLDLSLNQRPGNWIEMVTCAQARYDEIVAVGAFVYQSVEIHHDGEVIAKIDQIDVVS